MLLVTVPATTANLGPGFDALGIAVDLRLAVRMTLSAEDTFTYRGEGELPAAKDNLIHQGFKAAHERLGHQAPPVTFEVDNPIPLARGLGSSSAALVAGVVLGNAHAGGQLTDEELLNLAAAVEGHPDNVAPAIYGGFTVSAEGGRGSYVTSSLPVPTGWRFLFGVPAAHLSTHASRGVVPSSLTLKDAVLTSSRAALWVAAVANDQPELLKVASDDVLHEPHRRSLVPGLVEARARALEAGAYAAFLSGAGPTLALVSSSAATVELKGLLAGFAGEEGRVLELSPATGYQLERC